MNESFTEPAPIDADGRWTTSHNEERWPLDEHFATKEEAEAFAREEGFQVGDTIELRRWQPDPNRVYGGDYVNRHGYVDDYDKCAGLTLRITYKLPGGRFGLDPAFCVLGFVKEPHV